MKTLSKNLLLGLLGGVCLSFTALGHNASAVTNQSIAVNQNVSVGACSVNYSSDCDKYFTFTVPKDGYISATITFAFDDVSKDVYLMDGDNNRYAVYYWNNSKPLKLQTGIIGVPAGTYKIYVDSYGSKSAAYTVKANYTESTKWETEFNDTIATADVIKTGAPIYGDAVNINGYDNDYYKWTADFTGRAFVAFTRPSSMSDGAFEISGLNWNNQSIFSELRINTYDALTTNSALFNVTEGQTYYFRVHEYYKVTGGTYGLTVQRFRTNLKNTTITVTPSMVYTGSAVYPTVVVKRNGKTLKRNTDYTLTWSNNVGIGIGKVVITGKGNYYGSISKTFTIKPKAPVIGVSSPSSRVGRVGWKKVTKASGYEYQYSSSSRFTGAVTKTVGEAARSSNISLTSGRRYYFRVRAYRIVKGQKIYSDWSEAKSVKVK